MEKWLGRVAVVTGASAGIGAAIAKALVKHGMNVVGIARRLDRLHALQEEFADLPGKFFSLEGDVSSEESIESNVEWIKEMFGTIDVLVNNAGIYRPGQLSDQPIKYIRETIDVNILGLLIWTQKAVQIMKENNVTDGIIIQMNSVMGHQVLAMGPVPAYSVYPVTKHGITAAAEILRNELWFQRCSIRVTSISPGYVESELTQVGSEAVGISQEGEGFDADVLARELRALDGDDVADAVVFVLSTNPRMQIHEMVIKAVGDTMINRPLE